MSIEKENPSSKELADFCAEMAIEKKAENVVVINLGQSSSVSDYFVICTGTSHPHIGALSEWIMRKTREVHSMRPVAKDGEKESDWIVIDFGNVMIHIFTNEARERYNLENLWSDSEKIEKLLKEKNITRDQSFNLPL